MSGDTWCIGCSALETCQGHLKTPWNYPGLRQVVEETLLSGARLCRAFSNLDKTLKPEEAKAGVAAGESAAPATTSAKSKAEPARSRTPRRERRDRSPTPLPRSAGRGRPAVTGDTDNSEVEGAEEDPSEEEESPPPTRTRRGSERPPEPEGPPPRKPHRKRVSGIRRRGGTRHQKHWRERDDPLRRSHRPLDRDKTELAASFQEGLERRI